MQATTIKKVKGLILALTLALIALAISPVLGKIVGSFSPVATKAISNPLLVAILIGLIIGNTVYSKFKPFVSPGIDLAKKQVLRIAIVLYGFNITFSELIDIGISALIIDVIIVFGTFFLTLWMSKRFFGVDRETAMLIGSGASICGAAAVLAAEPVVKAPAHKVSVALATVVLFGTISMFFYPIIYSTGILPFTASEFGIYSGATIHEVAQVAAVGSVISDDVMNTAVITKMARVILLAPFLLMLTFMLRNNPSEGEEKGKITVPWFAIGFIIVIGLHSIQLNGESIWPDFIIESIVDLDKIMLCMAMGALGLSTQFRDMQTVGLAPFKLAAAVLVWLIFGGAIITMTVNMLVK